MINSPVRAISRRKTLQKLGSSAIGTLPLLNSNHATQESGHSFDFLATGDTTVNGPTTEADVPDDGGIKIEDELAQANLRHLQHMIEGGVHGTNGRLAMGSETTRTAQFTAKTAETKEARLVTEGSQNYEHRNYGTSGKASVGHSAGLVVRDLTTGETLTHDAKPLHAEATAEIAEWTVEQLLTRLATWIIFPGAGLIARIIIDLTLGSLIDAAIEFDASGSSANNFGADRETFKTSFNTQPDHTYEVAFTVTGGLSAETPHTSETYGDDIAHATAQSSYLINEFTVEPETSLF